MSLDVYLTGASCEHCGRGGEEVFSANVTHNLNTMAEAAGIYEHLWRPDGLTPPATKASDLIEPLRSGLAWLRTHGEEAKKLNPANGWGDYGGLVSFVEKYLAACEANPNASVRVWR